MNEIICYKALIQDLCIKFDDITKMAYGGACFKVLESLDTVWANLNHILKQAQTNLMTSFSQSNLSIEGYPKETQKWSL